jgi:predicted DNA-binding ribbon-helix-helix protein
MGPIFRHGDHHMIDGDDAGLRKAGKVVDAGKPAAASVLVSKHQCEAGMSRLTITLSEARYRALKEASAQRDKTIGQLIDESLDFYGIKSREDARDLVRRARTRSKLSDTQALAVAQEQVRAVRRKP